MSALARPRGRYDGGRDAALPSGQPLARPVPSLNVRTRVGAVQDPLRKGKRIQATIALTVDVLENDLAHEDLTEAGYAMGRMLQAVWERADGARLGSPSLTGSSGGDRKIALERRILGIVMDAHRIVAFEQDVDKTVGEAGRRWLRRVLVGGKSYKESASEIFGREDRYATASVADRTRWLLENLASAFRL